MNIVNSNTWKALKKTFNEDRKDLIEELVKADEGKSADIIRGKIQQIDDVLETYPHRINKSDE